MPQQDSDTTRCSATSQDTPAPSVARLIAGNTIPRPMQLIDELRDERREGNGWFVYLKPGWAISDNNTDAAQHCFGEDTKGGVWRTMKRARPCRCNDCLTYDQRPGPPQRERVSLGDTSNTDPSPPAQSAES